MHNLETPTYKLALFGARSSLGSALLVEALSRQWEVTALVDDLNALDSRPGLRTKVGALDDALAASQAVAGMDAVLCYLPGVPLAPERAMRSDGAFDQAFIAIGALLDGLAVARVKRLMVIADFGWMDTDSGHPAQPGQQLQQRLVDSPLAWTLADAPAGAETPGQYLTLAEFREGHEEPRVAALLAQAQALLDECRLAAHVRQRVKVDASG
ncbi:NAD(P)H-binding protein [Metapseudomonas otitidis]|uniref:NAD(P)H-binding protein n=1 Tax=Metapseudomonas otitidis TaxID=319939 RepID=UPI003CEDDB6A